MNYLIALRIDRDMIWLITLFVPAVLLQVTYKRIGSSIFRKVVKWVKIFLFLIAFVGLCSVFYAPFLSAFVVRQNVTCNENMRILSRALLDYADDWDDTFPPANQWYTEGRAFLGSEKKIGVIRCPASSSPYTYALNISLGKGLLYKRDNWQDIVMLFECDATGPDAYGNKDIITPEKRHPGDLNFAFLDGHVKFVRCEAWNKLGW